MYENIERRGFYYGQRYAARKAFGGVEQAKEWSRDARGVRWLEELWQDLRLSVGSQLRIGLLPDNPYTFYGALPRRAESSSLLVTDGAQYRSICWITNSVPSAWET